MVVFYVPSIDKIRIRIENFIRLIRQKWNRAYQVPIKANKLYLSSNSTFSLGLLNVWLDDIASITSACRVAPLAMEERKYVLLAWTGTLNRGKEKGSGWSSRGEKERAHSASTRSSWTTSSVLLIPNSINPCPLSVLTFAFLESMGSNNNESGLIRRFVDTAGEGKERVRDEVAHPLSHSPDFKCA